MQLCPDGDRHAMAFAPPVLIQQPLQELQADTPERIVITKKGVYSAVGVWMRFDVLSNVTEDTVITLYRTAGQTRTRAACWTLAHHIERSGGRPTNLYFGTVTGIGEAWELGLRVGVTNIIGQKAWIAASFYNEGAHPQSSPGTFHGQDVRVNSPRVVEFDAATVGAGLNLYSFGLLRVARRIVSLGAGTLNVRTLQPDSGAIITDALTVANRDVIDVDALGIDADPGNAPGIRVHY